MLYEEFHVAASGVPLFQAATANLNPKDNTVAWALYDTTRPYTLLFPGGIHQHFFRIPLDEPALPAPGPRR